MATVMLPNRIKLLRCQRMWSQKDLARRVGISQASLCQIENGTARQPRLPTLLGIARALGEPIELIFVPMQYETDLGELVPNGLEGACEGQGTASAAEVVPTHVAGPEKA